MNGEGYAPPGTINPISPNVIMNPVAGCGQIQFGGTPIKIS